MRQSERGAYILLNDDEGSSLAGKLPTYADQILYDQRRQSLERFVEQYELRFTHQCARNRQHLLLTAGQIAAKIFAPLCQSRKHLVGSLVAPAVSRGEA